MYQSYISTNGSTIMQPLHELVTLVVEMSLMRRDHWIVFRAVGMADELLEASQNVRHFLKQLPSSVSLQHQESRQ